MPEPITLEVCVDSAQGLATAIEGGADRIELCSALEIGGLTPSFGLLRIAASSRVPVVAMIRPRGGDFCFDETETQVMLHEIDAVADAGLQGVVLGASLPDGGLDARTLERLVRRASDHGLRCTLHRAIDLCPDLAQATAQAIELGFERILTSGGARSAPEGLDGLQRCFAAAAGRITIMPGAGINAGNVNLLRSRLALTDVHASCSAPLPAPSPQVAAFGFDSGGRRQTDSSKVASLKAALLV
ncbi:copper homeostasis protein CutC [Massilia sp. YIM B02443]|uniref:copper homeostasis protein CutC n=1 Tax=Massilia sp. YIM B02443 TaxID=3050127 RepID=UPI0025B62EEF|nr:copper homeostasis protein CutC [Massilia sp. YIM B02443]MDN4040010.1 copper homeostasis protein CutC [Massilia sp. YIM B02443]